MSSDVRMGDGEMASPSLFSGLIAGFSRLVVLTISSVVLVIIIRNTAIVSFKVPSGSMSPTLLPGDYVLMSRLCYELISPTTSETLYSWRAPERADVVLLYGKFSPRLEGKNFFVKRIIALPGETVEGSDRVLAITGSRDIRVELSDLEDFGPVTLGNDEYFVLGDNYQSSYDSRFFGPVKRRDIIGCGLGVYYSQSVKNGARDWSRIGRIR